MGLIRIRGLTTIRDPYLMGVSIFCFYIKFKDLIHFFRPISKPFLNAVEIIFPSLCAIKIEK